MKKFLVFLTPLLVLALVLSLAGCGGDEEESTPTPTKTAAATATPEPTTISQGYTGGTHTFKLSHQNPTNDLTHETALYIDERLQYYTDGQVKLEIFPMSSLFSPYESWDALATGALDIGLLGDYVIQMNGYLDYQIGYLPFFWGETMEDAPAHDQRFWEHPDGGKTLFSQVEPKGVKILSAFAGGHLQINLTPKKELISWYDIDNLKIVTVGGLTGIFAKCAGAVQVPLDPAEWSVSWQQGMFDILPTSPSQAYSMRYHESAKYGLVISGLISHNFFTMSLKLWDSLSPELQDIILNKVMPEVEQFSLERRTEAELSAIQSMADEGIIMHYMPESEREEFRLKAMAMAEEEGFIAPMNQGLIELADSLR